MQINIKISNRKELQLKALINLGYTYTGIDKQLVKEEKIKIESINRLFEIFNIDGTKNREVIQFVLLEVEINGYKEYINPAVIDLNNMDIFLGYNQLIKHNLEVNWNMRII